ncbi:hypothetical protein ACOQ7M_001646 [Campylobacter jejuni]
MIEIMGASITEAALTSLIVLVAIYLFSQLIEYNMLKDKNKDDKE